MSLLNSTMEPCVLLDKNRSIDDRGSLVTVWKEGANFEAAITYDTSIEGKIAAAQGVKDLITVTTARAITLDYHDVFRCVTDGKTYIVTSQGAINKTPKGAGLDMRQVSAEEYQLTGD